MSFLKRIKSLFRPRKQYNLWKKANGDDTLLLNHEMTKNSLVLDVGGYKGIWTEKIINKYNCKVYIFEPVKEFIQVLNNKFGDNSKVKIFEFGLGGRTRIEYISDDDDASSVFRKAGSEQIKIVNINNFIRENKLTKIDLLCMNIEGGEYELLEALISSGNISKVSELQVQFHRDIPGAKERRRIIRKNLSKTHVLIYNFPFIWEKWSLRPPL
mgnify:CR=1 FL=1